MLITMVMMATSDFHLLRAAVAVTGVTGVISGK